MRGLRLCYPMVPVSFVGGVVLTDFKMEDVTLRQLWTHVDQVGIGPYCWDTSSFVPLCTGWDTLWLDPWCDDVKGAPFGDIPNTARADIIKMKLYKIKGHPSTRNHRLRMLLQDP